MTDPDITSLQFVTGSYKRGGFVMQQPQRISKGMPGASEAIQACTPQLTHPLQWPKQQQFHLGSNQWLILNGSWTFHRLSACCPHIDILQVLHNHDVVRAGYLTVLPPSLDVLARPHNTQGVINRIVDRRQVEVQDWCYNFLVESHWPMGVAFILVSECFTFPVDKWTWHGSSQQRGWGAYW
jgi:hypothetical protein